jgi:enterochelin esterase-like enzyme
MSLATRAAALPDAAAEVVASFVERTAQSGLGGIRLAGNRLEVVLLVLTALAAGFAVAMWRRGGARRWLSSGLALLLLVATGAFGVNTELHAYPTLADLLGVPRYPSPTALPEADERENGAVAAIDVPDTASGFGHYVADVWLPPQYFTQPSARFPVVILAHGNPGRSTDWLDSGSAAETGLEVARAGHPVILVMPTVLQEPDGDSLCVDTHSQGNAETYVVQDVVAAADSQLRTVPDAAHRVIGGFSMGGFCALNLGLRHPDVFSVVLAFSALTVCEPDDIPGGNEALFGTPDWQERAAANSPAVYYPTLDPRKGPAVWLDAGDDETEIVGPMKTLGTDLEERGFTVEVHTRPGGHDFETWAPALEQSLPWAAARLESPFS